MILYKKFVTENDGSKWVATLKGCTHPLVAGHHNFYDITLVGYGNTRTDAIDELVTQIDICIKNIKTELYTNNISTDIIDK